ncbi:glycosyltransferase family 4 protein [Rhizobium sp. AQ_MP]|jgi:glycosyltransferase involved in cell wall biosynthesis|uniref:glycosyltransferase family 4 protein n=1 Tax=Rhizobium sp. AQ_MP TaxID=2761536 RepID=UPI00163B4EF2|nr:glycosyltransferase family 4 protein [Rhizobium sp. AQ_MP]MBC2774681.1 glycosyltransferase family 4 protein [Rhizobium sp. AQ_MP]
MIELTQGADNYQMDRSPQDPLITRSGAKRLLYVATEDWFYATHFLPLARAARSKGFEVVIVTRVSTYRKQLEAEGFRLIDLQADRSVFGPLALIRTIGRLRTIFIREKPALVHAIALKSVVLGGLAARLSGAPPMVYSLTGLGYLWSTDGYAAGLLRWIVRRFLGSLDRKGASAFTFENDDDSAEFPNLRSRTVIGGWGMQADEILPQARRNASPVLVVYLGRMLKAKGIEATVRAVEEARGRNDIALELWGAPDPGNLTSLSQTDLERLSERPGIAWRGRAPHARDAWRRADIAILLSDREGMPRSLIEAASAGLPLVAYDVAGCRSIVRDNVNGFLLPYGDEAAVADALARLAAEPDLRHRLGAAAREEFEARFAADSVIPRILTIYFNLVPQPEMG